MFECVIYIHLPLAKEPAIQIARYEFDPGLQLGEQVKIVNLKWGWEDSESFSIEAIVKSRRYEIRPQEKPQNDIFRLLVGLEMIDKELQQRAIAILEKLNPEEINRYIILQDKEEIRKVL